MSDRRSQSRAEVVRQRRSQQTARRASDSAARIRSAPATVTARGTAAAFPTPARKPARPALRRYENAAGLSLNGTRVHVPALPQIRIGWRWASAAIVVFAFWALYMLWSLPQFRVSQAQVTGNQRIATAEIDAALGLRGQPVFSLDPRDIERAVRLAYPDLASASIGISFPAVVQVNVVERQPVIAWAQDNAVTWVDQGGIAFPPRGQAAGLIAVIASGRPPALAADPLADPLSAPPFITPGLVATLQALAPYVPAGTPILYDPRYGMGWQDNRGWLVYFGPNSGRMQLKLRVYESLAAWLIGRGIQPRLISVAYPDAPFYRLGQ